MKWNGMKRSKLVCAYKDARISISLNYIGIKADRWVCGMRGRRRAKGGMRKRRKNRKQIQTNSIQLNLNINLIVEVLFLMVFSVQSSLRCDYNNLSNWKHSTINGIDLIQRVKRLFNLWVRLLNWYGNGVLQIRNTGIDDYFSIPFKKNLF